MSFEGLSALVLPPELKDGSGYETYKKELAIWKLLKTCSATEAGPILFRSLNNNKRAKNAALELSADEIGSDKGYDLIVAKLDKVYGQEDNQKICAVLEKFESFKRSPNMTMSQFTLDFERLHNRVKEYGITYPDGVLAYRMMKSANMSKDHEQLLRATIESGKWSYKAVQEQSRKIFNDITSVTPDNPENVIKVEEPYFTRSNEPQECYFSYEDCDSIHYENFTESDNDQPQDYCYLQTGPENMDSYAPTGYREPECHDIYYGPSRTGQAPWKWGSGRPGYQNARYRNNQGYGRSNAGRPPFQNSNGFQRNEGMNNYNQSNNSKSNPYSMNPRDYRGNPTVCRKCRSLYHWWENCPHVTPQEKMNSAAKQKVLYSQNNGSSNGFPENLYIGLFQKSTPTTADEMVCLLTETVNKAVIDSGCTKTCCGQKWYDSYMQSLTADELKSIEPKETNAVFKFGDSTPVSAEKKVLLPMKMADVKLLLETEVVPTDIPLLLSKETMKRAEAKMDFVNDKIELFGREQPMICTSSGHYAIPIQTNASEADDSDLTNIILYTKDMSTKSKAQKLHTQFSHPTAKRLLKLIESAGLQDAELKEAIEKVTNECDICKIHKKGRPRPAVTFPLASEFNETVGMDLKTYLKDKIYFLHMVDHATRFSAAAVIRSKKKEVIIDRFFKHWIGIFGTPQKVLSDNGGEFANHDFEDMCRNLNINFMTTAAEAPWSNGLVEKHNGIIGEAVSKVKSDIKCSVEVALCWAVNAKNSLQNIYGFSPYQLVFGRNPTLPSVFTDKLPALEGVTSSQLVADHLNAMHAMRREFVRLESCEKVRRALRSKVRTHANIRYLSGEDVFYKREDETKWLGPARVIGQDGSKILLKIPTGPITVHSSCVRLTSDAELKRREGE